MTDRRPMYWLQLSSEMGRSRVVGDCPFCDRRVYGFRWSLAGSGKRCVCGALLGSISAMAPDRPRAHARGTQ